MREASSSGRGGGAFGGRFANLRFRISGTGGAPVGAPRALGLRQAIRDDRERIGVEAHAGVATAHLDVLALRPLLLEAPLPVDDSVRSAVDGGDGERQGAPR